MQLSAEQFGKAMVASGLLSADDLKALWTTLAPNERPQDGPAFAQWLRQQGKLNEFQAAELLSGRNTSLVLGEYVLVGKIGAGGMGQVFKAEHRVMKRRVAIKLLPPAMSKDEAAIKRFQREVQAAARLVHPNIVAAYDAGAQRGVWYLVMEYVEGRDLSALIKEHGPLPIEQACDYTLQAARGLAFAHSEGVIHRDIKPANLLLDKKGVVKILDMGLARFDGGDDGLTGTEQVMGTVDYMSPEQAANTKGVDARADIYSLGCTLWFLLAGKKLYDGDTMISRLMAHRDGPLPSLVKARDDAPWPLEQAFHKMIAKRPQDRQQTMDEVVAALEPYAGSSTKVGLGSSIGMGSATNPELAAFLSSVKSSATQTGTHGQTGPTMHAASRTRTVPDDATAAFTSAEAGTDPKSEILPNRVGIAGHARPQRDGRGGKRRKTPVKWIAGALGGLALLLLGAWIILQKPDGDVTKIEAPEGGRVAVVTTPAKATLDVRPSDHTAAASQAGASRVPSTEDIIKTLESGEYVWSEPENLGPNVNTAGDDLIPSLTSDQLRLLIRRPQGGSDLLESARRGVSEPFGPAVQLAPGSDYENDCFLTGNGLFLIYSAYNTEAGDQSGHDLYLRQRASLAAPWSPAKSINDVNTPSSEISPCLSDDGLILTFASNRPKGYGKYDLYMARRTSLDAPFARAANLGSAINSADNDGRPQLLADGRTILYSRGDRRFYSYRSPSNGVLTAIELPNWPSEFRRSWLAPDARTIYFQATRPGGLGKDDIWLSRRVPRTSAPTNIATPKQVADMAGEGAAKYTAELLHKLPGRAAEFVLDDKLRIDRALFDPITGLRLRDLLPSGDILAAVNPTIARDGRRSAWITEDGTLTVWDHAADKPLWSERMERPGDGRRGVKLSTDGRLLAAFVNRSLVVWNVDQHQLVMQADSNGFRGGLRWSPSGRWLYGDKNSGWFVCDLQEKRVADLGSTVNPCAIDFTQDESQVFVARQIEAGDPRCEYVAFDPETQRPLYALPDQGYGALAISPLGDDIFFSAPGPTEIRYAAADGTVDGSRVTSIGLGVDQLALSSDGTLLAAWNYRDQTVYVYRLHRNDVDDRPQTPRSSGSSGAVRNALRLTGAGYVDLASDWNYDGGDVTFEAWLIGDTPRSMHTYLAVDHDAGGRRHALRLSRRGDQRIIEVARPSEQLIVRFDDVLPSGRPTHFAAVWQGPEICVYVDGKRLTSRPHQYPFGPRPGKPYAWLGGMPADESLTKAQQGCDATLLETRITSRARYHGDFTPPAALTADAETVAHFKCDEGAGDVLHDSSGRSRQAKIVGAKWVRVDAGPAASAIKIDLLKNLDVVANAVAGRFALDREGLRVADGTLNARIALPVDPPPAEYDLHVAVGRLAPGGKAFIVGVPWQGSQGCVVVDGFSNPPLSGLELVDGLTPKENGTGKPGEKITFGPRNHKLVVRVRNDGIAAECDGEPLFDWKGKPAQFSTHAMWQVPRKDLPFLGFQGPYVVHGVELLPVAAQPVAGLDGKPARAEPADGAGWITLFDGRTLDGWETIGGGGWSAADGVLKAAGTGKGWIGTTRTFRDYELELEYRIQPGGNGGVALRAWREGGVSAKPYMEVQIIDDAATPTPFPTGSITDQVAAKPGFTAPIGAWNRIKVHLAGKHARVTFNGVVTVDADLPIERPEGMIGLQVWDRPVEYRNIRIREPSSPRAAAAARTPFLHDPAFEPWRKMVQALPEREQIDAVRAKLMELNPGFDGKLTDATGAKPLQVDPDGVVSVGFSSDDVTDVSPLRALPNLRYLTCNGHKFGKGKLADLSPLAGLPLSNFTSYTSSIADLSPLRDCPSLGVVHLATTHVTAAQVEALQAALPACRVEWDGLTDPAASERRIAEWVLLTGGGLQVLVEQRPITVANIGEIPAEPFWNNHVSLKTATNDDLARFERSVGLTSLHLNGTSVGDAGLAHLKGLTKLQALSLSKTSVTDAAVAPLAGVKRLTQLNLKGTRVTSAGVAALQKALPACRIEWDDPTQPTTPAPAATGSK